VIGHAIVRSRLPENAQALVTTRGTRMIRYGARRSFAVVGTVASALLVLFPGGASAAGPQPDPPAFGMLGITSAQRAHLHVALAAVQRTGKDRFQGTVVGCPSDPSVGTLEAFASDSGESHTIVPAQLILPVKP